MGIFDAVTTAVTGLQAQSFALQNISGNIANSQTTAYKETDTSFQDMVTATGLSTQVSGTVSENSVATNSVAGQIQSTQVATDMAISGDGYFVVSQPTSYSDNQPVFSGTDDYTRRGDFTENAQGYLVNGAGYYLMGIPVDPTTGNATGSVPQVLQFNNTTMPAQATTTIQYQANLPSYPQTTDSNTSVSGSELLNPDAFTANPLAGASPFAQITGTGASIQPDAVATMTGTASVSSPLTWSGSSSATLVINGTSITVASGDDIVNDINAQTATTGVSAAITNSQLVLTGANATTNIAIGSGSTGALLSQVGLTSGATANATNLLTQNDVTSGETLTVAIGSNGPYTVTFGTASGDVETLAGLSSALSSLIPSSVGTASVDANGNITITAASSTDTVTVGGTANAQEFGIQNDTAMPANGTVLAQDNTQFVDQSVAGGSVTAYTSTGNPVDLQFRWAKVSDASNGGTDSWQLFYQTNPNATGTQAEWQNVGTTFSFDSSGQLTPSLSNLTLNNVTVGGTSLGNIQLQFGTNGLTQYAASSGAVQINNVTANGSAAGQLQSLAVNGQNQLTGTFSNGQTITLAEIPLATFSGQDNLQNLNGEAFAATAESGPANFSGSGQIVGSSLEASNVDIANQFSNLIVAQEAYSANAKVMTTANQMVQSLLTIIQ
jgi:flagellar hook protein FlgE